MQATRLSGSTFSVGTSAGASRTETRILRAPRAQQRQRSPSFIAPTTAAATPVAASKYTLAAVPATAATAAAAPPVALVPSRPSPQSHGFAGTALRNHGARSRQQQRWALHSQANPASPAAASGASRASLASASAPAPAATPPTSTSASTSVGSGGATGSPANAAAGAGANVDDFASDQRPIILFDGVCNLCNGGVNFMLDNDPGGAFRLAALQSPAGRRLLNRCGRRPDDISSIVLVERERHFIRSEAVLRIGARLRIPLPLLASFGFPVPLPLRDAVYDGVANNRYSFFGRTDACRLRDAGKFADRFIVD